MLLRFRVKNFKSFAYEAILDMTAAPIKERQDSIMEVNGLGILPVAAVYGANASGKSNLLEALVAMFSIVADNSITGNIMDGSGQKVNLAIPFMLDKSSRNEDVEFEACILLDDKEYRYGFKVSGEKFTEEWLFGKKFAKGTRAKEKLVFYRNVTEGAGEHNIPAKDKKMYEYCNEMVADKELLLVALAKRDVEPMDWLVYYMRSTFSVLVREKFLDSYLEYDIADSLEEWLQLDATQNMDIIGWVREFDPSIKNIVIRDVKDNSGKEKKKIFTIHMVDGNEEEFPLGFESCGTRRILGIMQFVLLALSAGILIVVDELDTKLHPLVLRSIAFMFHDSDINKNGAQLIFSGHNLICLDNRDFRRDEIWFVEKQQQRSELFSLYDIKNYNDAAVRNDLDFGKHYLAGRFGAIPFMEKD